MTANNHTSDSVQYQHKTWLST